MLQRRGDRSETCTGGGCVGKLGQQIVNAIADAVKGDRWHLGSNGAETPLQHILVAMDDARREGLVSETAGDEIERISMRRKDDAAPAEGQIQIEGGVESIHEQSGDTVQCAQTVFG